MCAKGRVRHETCLRLTIHTQINVYCVIFSVNRLQSSAPRLAIYQTTFWPMSTCPCFPRGLPHFYTCILVLGLSLLCVFGREFAILLYIQYILFNDTYK